LQIEGDRTPLWHNNETQVGVNRPPAMHHVGLWDWLVH